MVFAGLVNSMVTVGAALSVGGVAVDGDMAQVEALFADLDVFPQMFNVVEP